MECMFPGNSDVLGGSSLKTINLITFNTQQVTNMLGMFCNCSSLTILNLVSFNTEKVTDMRWMFKNCSALKYLNLLSFKADKANIDSMLSSCKKLSRCKVLDEKINNEL